MIEGSPRRTKKAAAPKPISVRTGAANAPEPSSGETPDQRMAPATPLRITRAINPTEAVRDPITTFRIPRILM